MPDTIEIVREPLTYEQHQGHLPESERTSYCADLARAKFLDNDVARERLERHAREMERTKTETRNAPSSLGLEYRVNPNRTQGQGGYFAPPLWIISAFATTPRAESVLTRLIPSFDLPEGVQSVNVPRLVTGGANDVPADNAAQYEEGWTDAAVSQPVSTFSAKVDYSLQALDQSPQGAHLDWAVFTALQEGYIGAVESSLLMGTGVGPEFTGMLNLSGTTKTKFNETVSANKELGTKMFPYIGQTIAQVGVKRKRPPEALLMTTSRLAWLGTSEDNQNRPLLLTDYTGSNFPVASLTGIGVYLDDSIPTNLGKEKTQDVIIACRPTDFIFLSSAPKAAVMEDVLSGTLEARFLMHTYATIH